MLQYEWFSNVKRESILRRESVRWLGSQSESLLSFWRVSPWRNFTLGKAQTIPALAGQSLLMATQICSCFLRERKQLMWPVTKLTQRGSSFVLAKLRQTLDYTTWEMLADGMKSSGFFFSLGAEWRDLVCLGFLRTSCTGAVFAAPNFWP